ncbi:MAG: class I SAM-dependent methyltransferase [Candidatus Parabeggiatoa sp.]|nr:class I SAM-dependent methyltransferase [Candidatus Parabeggiatoa sp.]
MKLPMIYKKDLVHFDLELRIKSDEFMPTLQDFQREWLMCKFMNESARDLQQTNLLSQRFVRGTKRPDLPENWDKQAVQYDETQLLLQGHQVMQSWEHRIMQAMAENVTETHGDVLEIGFGMGISATYIQEYGVRTYTIVEPNDAVVKAFKQWHQSYALTPIHLLHGTWQEVSEQFGQYDGVLFDPYFVSEPDSVEVESSTGVGSFLPLIVPHLREGGVMTYFTREIDSLSRAHQRLLFKYFRAVEMKKIEDLVPPDDCNYWWADSMMVVKAIK